MTVLLGLAASLPAPAVAQAPEGRPPHEWLLEGLRSFLRGLFGAGEPAEPPHREETRTAETPPKPVAAPEPAAAVPVPSPAAQAQPHSLQALAARGDEEGVRRLLAEGADPEAKDPATGASVLHYAVMRGNRAIVALLLERGVDVNSRTRTGTTPLHSAVLYNHYEVAEMLLARGADVNAQSASGATPLALATAARRRELADLLRARGGR